jgi:hypothetical protein
MYGTLKLVARLTPAPEKIRKLGALSDNIVGGYLIVFNLMYLSLCRSAMDIFNCREMVPPDGYSYMASTYDRCYESGGPHAFLLPYAVLSVTFYCVGFPVVLSTALWWNREDIAKDMELRATQQHVRRKMSSFYSISLRYGRFYKYFHPGCLQWNMIIMFRKFFIASTALLFRENPTFQLSISLVGMILMFAAQGTYRPYWSVEEQYDYAEELFSEKRRLADISSELQKMLLAQAGRKGRAEKSHNLRKESRTKTQGVDMEKMMHDERSSVLANAKNILFNLNTIESVMLMSVILVTFALPIYPSVSLDLP